MAKLEKIGKDRTLKQRGNDLKHYIGTALWSELDGDSGTELDQNYDLDDMDPQTLGIMSNELDRFIDEFYPLVTEEDERTDMEYFVHNLWLNRNGHGAGFWDSRYKNGDEISDAATNLGNLTLYVGDDNKIYSTS